LAMSWAFTIVRDDILQSTMKHPLHEQLETL
jgi:hypothetical protein